MRRLSILLLTTSLLASAAAIFACTQPAKVNRLPVDDDDDDDDDTPTKRRDAGPGGEIPPGADPPLPDGGKPPGRIYAHTKSTLYRYDPLANSLTEIGPFNCVPHDETKPAQSVENDEVIDLALDRTGQMYATTFWRFIKVDPTSGGCQVIKTESVLGMYPNSLSFVPFGSEEALVGYAFDVDDHATIYTRIDLASGVMTDLEGLNPATPLNGVKYGISGDLISLVRTNGKTYGAIKQVDPDVGGNDLLAEIDPATGTIKSIIGDTGQKGFWGMGFWAGKAYGFTNNGNIHEVDVTNGSSKVVMQAKDTNGLSVAWYGAGVTTDSPTAP